LAAATEAPDTLAGSCATSEFVTVAPGERLDAAAQLMQQHDVSHLMVVDRAGDVPIGVLSTLDIAGIVAWGRA
jgi:CBS domain-containing protein